MRRIRISMPVVSLLAVSFLLSGCSAPTVPSSYETFNAKDGTVQCKCPAGWTQSGGGGKKFVSCSFTSGGAQIRVAADIAGSAIGDIAKSGNDMMGFTDDMLSAEEAEELTPVAQVHELSIAQAGDDLKDMDVKSTETIQTGLGETRVSEFTASGAMGSSVHGMLATALGMNHRIRVTCTCSESHWEAMKPVFNEVISSIARGQAEL